jgi:hypothetical protein
MSKVSIMARNIVGSKIYKILFYIILIGVLISYFFGEMGIRIGVACAWFFVFVDEILSYLADKQNQSSVVHENKRIEVIDRIIKLLRLLKLAAAAYLVYYFLFVEPIGGYLFVICIIFATFHNRLVDWLEKKKKKEDRS